MDSTNKISQKIYGTCHDAERIVAENDERESRIWAKTNATRIAYTVQAIASHINSTGKKHIRILNSAGIGYGSETFSIMQYLLDSTDVTAECTVIDSPQNPIPRHEHIQKEAKKYGINLIFHDFSEPTNGKTCNFASSKFDIALFTEIAEHLDISVFVRTMQSLRQCIADDGILILTTPNLLYLPNRIRMLLGNGDSQLWGERIQDIDSGIMGHIINYDIFRLKRILDDTGYITKNAFTFNFGHSPKKYGILQRAAIMTIDTLSLLGRYTRQGIFVVASPK